MRPWPSISIPAPFMPVAKLPPPTLQMAMTPKIKCAAEPKTPLAGEPRTPLNGGSDRCRFFSPPPPPCATARGMPALTKCLRNGGVEQVRACLAAEPEAASQFFFDCSFEPVACCAVRLGCSPAVVRLLLRHGADATACDTTGYSPLTCLASQPAIPQKVADSTGCLPVVTARLTSVFKAMQVKSLRQRVEVARMLLEAGAHPQVHDGGKRLPAAVARSAGNVELARFLEHFLEVQACITLKRAQRGHAIISGLPGDAFQVVLAHLLPADLVKWSQEAAP